jgi:hypothetical protein
MIPAAASSSNLLILYGVARPLRRSELEMILGVAASVGSVRWLLFLILMTVGRASHVVKGLVAEDHRVVAAVGSSLCGRSIKILPWDTSLWDSTTGVDRTVVRLMRLLNLRCRHAYFVELYREASCVRTSMMLLVLCFLVDCDLEVR